MNICVRGFPSTGKSLSIQHTAAIEYGINSLGPGELIHFENIILSWFFLNINGIYRVM